MKKSQLEGPLESPVSFHAGSNGELAPPPVSPLARRAAERYRRLVEPRLGPQGLRTHAEHVAILRRELLLRRALRL
jgi:hypothetical protein